MFKICLICQNKYKVKPYRFKMSKTCSLKCWYEYLKKYGFTEECKKKMSVAKKGKQLTLEHRKKMSIAHLKRLKEHPIKWETRIKLSLGKLGDKNVFWEGGKSYDIYPIGWTKTFTEQIRIRDNYKCQLCGIPQSKCYRKLDIHHKDKNKYNLKLDNLISLCRKCHKELHWIEQRQAEIDKKFGKQKES